MSEPHPLTLLVARYGQAQGTYLFGEYCQLLTLGFDSFRTRHTPPQLEALAAQLGAVALWPEGPPPASHPVQGRLESVASTLTRPALQLALGADLFRACRDWADVQSPADPDVAVWFEASRLALTETLGFTPPPLVISMDEGPPSHGYFLMIWGEVVAEGEAFPGQDLMLGPAHEAPPQVPYPWMRDPAGDGWACWLPIGPEAEPPEELTRLHWMTALDRHVTALLPMHAHRLLTAPVVHDMLGQAEAGGYDHELERYISVPELRLVFQALLRQGLPLRPLAPILEALLTSLIADMARRPLAPPELERLSRQLPVFPTERLVGIVRRSLGLSAVPGPRPVLGGPPALAVEQPPAPDPVEREQWRALFDLAAASRPTARAWLQAVRATQPLALQRRGAKLRWSFEQPLGVAHPDHLSALAPLEADGSLPALERSLDRFLALCRPLREIEAWLEGRRPGPLSDEARRMVEAPSWAEWRWQLGEPRLWPTSVEESLRGPSTGGA